MFGVYSGARDSREFSSAFFQSKHKLCSSFTLRRMLIDRDIELQRHDPYYSLRAPTREVAEMIPHPDEEESSFSRQSLGNFGFIVRLLG